MLSVREMNFSDIDHIVNYWTTSSNEHMTNMGVDLNKLPSNEGLTEVLTLQLNLPLEQKRSYCIIWEDGGKSIGHCNTNPTKFGEEAYMHLHLWRTDVRKKGLGSALLKMTLPYFFNNLKLKRLFSEPYALNPAPNKTLQKVGFHLVKEYITTPGSVNFEQPVKCWLLTSEKFKNLYL